MMNLQIFREGILREEMLEAIFTGMRRVRPAFRKLFSLASDLTDVEVVILGKMVEGGVEEVSIKELFDDLSPIRPSKLTQVTNRLEERGYIRKERDPRDRRRIRVIITEEGRREYEALQERMKSMLYGAVGNLSAQEMEVLARSLEIWERALKNL
jgi:DNA-binding MarR family transcriptional regulator